MTKNIKRFLIGRPLKNEALAEERYGVMWGLPILSSDAISSVAYASEEILMVLVPVIAAAAYTQLAYISAAIIGLLVLLTLSYRQTIESYPNGGGAYVVAKENLGVLAGVTAGAALSVDYILTVAVSISSASDAITSAFPAIYEYRVLICIGFLILIMIGNLRGIGESSKIFSIPAYAFMIAILSMIVVGVHRYFTGITIPQPAFEQTSPITSWMMVILILRAFSNGCAALTGVEAVSNAVPNFKEPSTKYAKRTLALLSLLVFTLFGGTSLLANLYPVVHQPGRTVLSQIAIEIFGQGPMFYYIQITTMIILAMAANTAFTGFPLLISVMAKEGYVPRQLSMRGDRLSYSNGIIVLTAVSALLIVLFNADVSKLIGLYAIGVFISFTLSQSGMLVKWTRSKEKGWKNKAFVNGFGAVVTAIVVVIIAIFKFHEGAWIVVLLVPLMIFAMMKVKKHYIAVSRQLRMKPEELETIDIERDVYRNRVIVPIESINKSSIRALRFARTISDNVVAFSVAIDEESAQKLQERYKLLKTEIPLIVKYSPYRKVVEPLLKFIESAEYDYQKGDMITVILPQFSVKSWWHNFLHNQTRVFVERELLKHKHIVVSVMPLQLKRDDMILNNPKYDR
ncbi:MAG: APC family permease [Clostridia bacterium]|nr:APC family permease [Clostridia bacterium]